MLVAGYCFRDEEMKRSVLMNAVGAGTCEVSGCEEKLIDLEFFYDFFDEALSLFMQDDNGSPLLRIIQDEWQLFVSDAIGETILNRVCSDLESSFSALSLVSYTEDVKRRISVWDALKSSVLKDRRYFSGHEDLDHYAFLIPEATLKKKTVLFRARVLPKDKKRLKQSEMGCPPPHLATPGRANPRGISYLYLCSDEVTTYSEVRAVQLDRLCIGRFLVKEDLAIVDFPVPVGPVMFITSFS